MKFDLRFPIGILFSLYGALLVIFGAMSDKELYSRSLGINVNFWWGIVLLVFGVLMLLGAVSGRKKPPSAWKPQLKWHTWENFSPAEFPLHKILDESREWMDYQPPITKIEQAQVILKDRLDFYVDGGDYSGRESSALIQIIDDAVEVIRPGHGFN